MYYIYINDIPDDVIAIYADDTTLYPKCDQAYDLWQQLELASELESDLRHTVDSGKKCPCMEYCCHVWAGVPSCYLELLDKLQNRYAGLLVLYLLLLLNPLAHC